MSPRATGSRRGAHRTSRDIASAFVPSLLAVLAVTAMITALYVWRGESPDTATPASATTQSSTAPAPTTPSPSATATKAPVKPAPTTTTSSPPSTKATTASAESVGDVEVVVLNATSRKGLAGTVAQRLRDKGWTVAMVGNFRGNVTATTVYYPPGAQADAEAAAAGLPTEPRVRPRFGNLSTSRLTVVVTDSYPS
jgi:LytR cell envelope-related transcriptional attenuator